MKKIVFFDFFGVIGSEIAPIWFRKYLEDEDADKIKSEIVSLGDVGKISEWEMYEMISKRLNVKPEQIAQEWQDLVSINDELVGEILKIKEKYPVYLLSNAIEPFLVRILEKYQLFSLFDKVYISSKMGIAKPSGEFFQYVINDLHVDPEDVVMIDDNPSNLAGAASCGIDGILFSENNSFKREFDSYFG